MSVVIIDGNLSFCICLKVRDLVLPLDIRYFASILYPPLAILYLIQYVAHVLDSMAI